MTHNRRIFLNITVSSCATVWLERVIQVRGATLMASIGFEAGEMWCQEHMNIWTDAWLIFLTAWVIVFPKSQLVNKIFRDLPKRMDG